MLRRTKRFALRDCNPEMSLATNARSQIVHKNLRTDKRRCPTSPAILATYRTSSVSRSKPDVLELLHRLHPLIKNRPASYSWERHCCWNTRAYFQFLDLKKLLFWVERHTGEKRKKNWDPMCVCISVCCCLYWIQMWTPIKEDHKNRRRCVYCVCVVDGEQKQIEGEQKQIEGESRHHIWYMMYAQHIS